MTKTYLPGKDDSLENAIDRMTKALASNGFNIIEHQWGNPTPNIWWVHIRDADNPMCFTNGKGGTKLAALASALGEFIERLSCNYFFADYYLGEPSNKKLQEQTNKKSRDFVHYPDEKWFSFTEGTLADNRPSGLLSKELATFYDPNATLKLTELHDINSGINERGICAIPFTRQRDGKAVYFPVNIIGNLYVSNGMSAGSTKMEARTQALSEVFERWIKNRIITEGIALPHVREDVLARSPEVFANITKMRDQGYIVHIYDASLGGEFPVIGAMLINTNDCGCLTSFGAHPNFSVALERTITELLQGRELKNLSQFPLPTFDNDWVSDAHNMETHFIDSTGLVSWDWFSERKDFAFVDWDFKSDTINEYNFLLKLIRKSADVYIADYDYLGVYACRVIVPSVSEIYPVEELTQYNNNIGNDMRDAMLSLPNSRKKEDFEAIISWLNDTHLDDSERFSQVFGLSIEHENPWHFVRLGELRGFAYLALGDFEQALDMTEWMMTFAIDAMPTRKLKFFRCLKEQLLLEMDDSRIATDYESIYREIFSDEIYDACLAHLRGETTMFDLPAIDDVCTFANHKKWLSRYAVWQSVKART